MALPPDEPCKVVGGALRPSTSLPGRRQAAAWTRCQLPPGLPKPTLWCLDHSTWRAECIRLCLFSAGIPFEDRRVTYAELSDSGVLRFGSLPVLEVGGRIIAQTHAIATYVGKLSGFYPADLWLGAKVDEVLAALTDVTDLLASTFQELDPQQRVHLRERLTSDSGRLTQILSGLEELLIENSQHGLCAGSRLSVADFAVWRAVGWVSGSLDGVPKDYISNQFPQMWSLHKRVDSLACVQEWKMVHARQYPPS